MPLAHLRDTAAEAGLEACPDLRAIWEEIKDSATIVDLGAGYGRAIEFLRAKEFPGSIVAVERELRFVTLLRQRHGHHATVLHASALAATIAGPVDTVLLLWSGITEYTLREQRELVQRSLSWLKPGGRLIVDVPALSSLIESAVVQGQEACVELSFGSLHVYIPSAQELADIASGAATVELVEYRTSAGRQRKAYILKCA